MVTESAFPFRMVVAVDSSDFADVVLERALDQAARHERPDLHVVTAVSQKARDDEVQEKLESLAQLLVRKLDDLGLDQDQVKHWRIRLHVRRGLPAEEVCGLAAEVEAGLIVAGRFGQSGKKRRRVGSVADNLLRLAPCPVLVVQLSDYGDHELSSQQCPECVKVRADSDGETWFCPDHRGLKLGTSTLLSPHAGYGLGGGAMY